MNTFILLKFSFSTTLLILFIFYFGIPSWNKFEAREVIINKRKISTEDIASPAVTICSGDGWKFYYDFDESIMAEYESDGSNNSEYDFDESKMADYESDGSNNSEYDFDGSNKADPEFDESNNANYEFDGSNKAGAEFDGTNPYNLHPSEAEFDACNQSNLCAFCKESNLFEQAIECIDTNTYNLTETVETALEYPAGSSNIDNATDILNSSFWINDFTYTDVGKCHTLNNSVFLGPSTWKFIFNSNLNDYIFPLTGYKVFIHDPDFFIPSKNPVTVPAVYLHLKPSQGTQFIYIEVVQHINFDRTEQPCEAREDYSFTACVKNSVARKVGCR
jgi:hypothetical protein